MRLQLRSALLSLRDLLLTGGPVLLLAIGLFWLAYRVLDPIPPQRMVLATLALTLLAGVLTWWMIQRRIRSSPWAVCPLCTAKWPLSTAFSQRERIFSFCW